MISKLSSILAFSIAVGLSAPAVADPVPSRPSKVACKPAKAQGDVWRPNANKCAKAKPGVSETGFGAGVGTGTAAAGAVTQTAVYVGFGILATTAIILVADRRDDKPISR